MTDCLRYIMMVFDVMPNSPLINSVLCRSRRKEAHNSSENGDKQSLLTSAPTI